MSAELLGPEISEPLTWDEICARHPDEWVCLLEIDFIHPNGLEFRTARVIGHGKTRRAPFDQARIWRTQYEDIGHFYTGHITERPLRPVVIIDDETRDAFRAALDWNPHPEKKFKAIRLTRPTNFLDRGAWPEAIAWLASNTVAFKQAFGPRIAALDL